MPEQISADQARHAFHRAWKHYRRLRAGETGTTKATNTARTKDQRHLNDPQTAGLEFCADFAQISEAALRNNRRRIAILRDYHLDGRSFAATGERQRLTRSQLSYDLRKIAEDAGRAIDAAGL